MVVSFWHDFKVIEVYVKTNFSSDTVYDTKHKYVALHKRNMFTNYSHQNYKPLKDQR